MTIQGYPRLSTAIQDYPRLSKNLSVKCFSFDDCALLILPVHELAASRPVDCERQMCTAAQGLSADRLYSDKYFPKFQDKLLTLFFEGFFQGMISAH